MSAVQGIEIDREELESHWLPFTDNKSFKDDPRLFVKGEGVYLWNQHGSRLLDGCSGLFTTAAGHCRQEITDAVAAQLQQLDYTSSFLRSHPRSFELANKLTSILPEPISKVFFCNSGSEANDTMIKMLSVSYTHLTLPTKA